MHLKLQKKWLIMQKKMQKTKEIRQCRISFVQAFRYPLDHHPIFQMLLGQSSPLAWQYVDLEMSSRWTFSFTSSQWRTWGFCFSYSFFFLFLSSFSSSFKRRGRKRGEETGEETKNLPHLRNLCPLGLGRSGQILSKPWYLFLLWEV